ncbi:hypothetical protein ZHAS_00003151 [Anopheles sinensis]|uniref:Uncharacterized protein n=1 Tax=Anopheles sinensis TaxID=74873 RepID=A0A084VDR3_ANOSI|nr:hypothetical protein ZHAS_00003151 [Anopheles sinensis]
MLPKIVFRCGDIPISRAIVVVVIEKGSMGIYRSELERPPPTPIRATRVPWKIGSALQKCYRKSGKELGTAPRVSS